MRCERSLIENPRDRRVIQRPQVIYLLEERLAPSLVTNFVKDLQYKLHPDVRPRRIGHQESCSVTSTP